MRGTRIFGMVLAVACLLAACTSPPRPDATSTGQPTLPPTSTEDVRSAEVTSRPPMTATRAAAVVSPSPTASPTRETPPSPTPSATPTPTASPTPTPTEVPPDARYDPAVLELVAQFNAWRMSEQRWPLRLNDTLVEMAQDQARYVASLPTIPYGVTIHLDAEGLEEKGRALRYGWPHYRTEQQVAVGEVAAVARTAQDAINWWKGSEVHRNISLSDAFREVGAAVVPVAGGGNLYIIVVGSRPGVLPALMDVETRQVYLTSERYRWAATGDWMQAVTRVQLVSSEAGPSALEGWLPRRRTGPSLRFWWRARTGYASWLSGWLRAGAGCGSRVSLQRPPRPCLLGRPHRTPRRPCRGFLPHQRGRPLRAQRPRPTPAAMCCCCMTTPRWRCSTCRAGGWTSAGWCR